MSYDNTPIKDSERRQAPRDVPLACKSVVILSHSRHFFLLATKLVSVT